MTIDDKAVTGPPLSGGYPESLTPDLWADMFEHCPDGIVIGPPDGRILYANPAACATFGTSKDHLRRLGLGGLGVSGDPGSDRVEPINGGGVRAVKPMRRADGSRFLGEASSAPFATDAGPLVCTILLDVTDRVSAERRLAAYDEIAEALLGRRDIPSVLAMVAKHARIIFNAQTAIISTVEGNGEVVVVAADGPAASALVGRAYPRPGTAIASEPLAIDDYTKVAVTEDGRLVLGVGPAMVVPILSNGKVFGNLFVGAPSGTAPYRPDELESARQFALRAGVVLALGQAREDLERRQQRTSDQLQRALDTRIPIEQAKGFLAATRHISTDEAFERLRSYARSHSTDIHEIADRVLQRTLLL